MSTPKHFDDDAPVVTNAKRVKCENYCQFPLISCGTGVAYGNFNVKGS